MGFSKFSQTKKLLLFKVNQKNLSSFVSVKIPEIIIYTKQIFYDLWGGPLLKTYLDVCLFYASRPHKVHGVTLNSEFWDLKLFFSWSNALTKTELFRDKKNFIVPTLVKMHLEMTCIYICRSIKNYYYFETIQKYIKNHVDSIRCVMCIV